MLLLARSERDQPRHARLSYFILDMRTDGVDARPLRQITGDAEDARAYAVSVDINRST
jgi:alkylation response protein AidB-like acyl-CoA dehydrogenase